MSLQNLEHFPGVWFCRKVQVDDQLNCINFVARSVRLLAVSDVSGTEATNTGLCGVLGPIAGNMLNSL